VGNNPVMFRDPDGMVMTDFVDENGKLIQHYEDGLNTVFKITGEGAFKYYVDVFDDVSGNINFTALFTEQQRLNENNPNLQPITLTNGKKETYCNFAVQNFLSALHTVDPNLSVFRGNANSMQGKFESSVDFQTTLSRDVASLKAFEGNLVIASWKNPNGHGHVAAFSTYTNMFNGEIANIGNSNGFKSLDASFGLKNHPERTLKYFIFNK
jgi:hypothetical protein